MTRGVKCNTPPLPTHDELLHKVLDLQTRIMELEELREENRRLRKVNKAYEEQIAEYAAVYAELDRLREAVNLPREWHTCSPNSHYAYIGCAACEVARRARGEG